MIYYVFSLMFLLFPRLVASAPSLSICRSSWPFLPGALAAPHAPSRGESAEKDTANEGAVNKNALDTYILQIISYILSVEGHMSVVSHGLLIVLVSLRVSLS